MCGARSTFTAIEAFAGSRPSSAKFRSPQNADPADPPAMPLWNPIVEGLFLMSELKDISRQRLSDFLAARLRAKRRDEPRAQRQHRNETNALRPEGPPRHRRVLNDARTTNRRLLSFENLPLSRSQSFHGRLRCAP